MRLGSSNSLFAQRNPVLQKAENHTPSGCEFFCGGLLVAVSCQRRQGGSRAILLAGPRGQVLAVIGPGSSDRRRGRQWLQPLGAGGKTRKR